MIKVSNLALESTIKRRGLLKIWISYNADWC